MTTTKIHLVAGLSISACLGFLTACGTTGGPPPGDTPGIPLPDSVCSGPTGAGYMTCPDYKPPTSIPWGTGG